MKFFSSLVLSGGVLLAGAPAAVAQQAPSPYHTRFAVDAPITLGLGAVSGFGLYRVQQKTGLTEAELAALRSCLS